MVLDFGLAKACETETTNASLSNSPTMSLAATQQDMILGTAAYMSPEQAKGRSVDKRTDIFAFGNPVPLGIKGLIQRVGNWRDYDIAPDGKQFLVMMPPGTTSTDTLQTPQIQVVLNWFEELKQRMSAQ